MKRATLIVGTLYLAVLIIAMAVTHTSLNTHWFVTSLLFSPRWVVALPLIVLIPWTLRVRWRLSFFYLVHAILILFPIHGFQLHRGSAATVNGGQVLTVLTCNVGGGPLDEEQFLKLVNDHQIDALLLQECMPAVAEALFDRLGWHRQQRHQIVIGSPHVLGEVRVLARQPKDHYEVVAAIACELNWPPGDSTQLVSLHLPTFRPAFEKLQRFDTNEGPAALESRGKIYREVAKQAREQVHEGKMPTVVAGDFNVPIESVFYREYWSDLQNAFSLSGFGFGYTKYTRIHGVRIDHVLADHQWTVLDAHVGPDLGGDHRPVIVQLERTPSK